MKPRDVLTRAALVLALASLWAGSALGQGGASAAKEDKKESDYGLFDDVKKDAVESALAIAKCQKSAEKLMQEFSDPVSAAFIAAKAAWICGRSSDAICILDSMVQEHGREVNKRWGAPNEVIADLWIGTMARQCGDARRANKAYERLLAAVTHDKSLNSTPEFVYLYEAELAETVDTEQALELLNKVKHVQAPTEKDRALNWQILQEWSEYGITRLKQGAEEARLALRGERRKHEACLVLAMVFLDANGIVAEPRAGMLTDDGATLLQASLDQVLACRTSPIDKAFAQLFLGSTREQQGDSAKAEKYYADLFAGESYFAPEGGVHLAQVQMRQGKKEEAEKTFAQVRQRYPGYAEFVDQLSKGATAPAATTGAAAGEPGQAPSRSTEPGAALPKEPAK